MTMNDQNIYDRMNAALEGVGTQTDPRAIQRIAKVHAQAAVDQAISLATIADLVERAVIHLVGGDPFATPEQDDPPTESDLPRGIQSEHDVEVGDYVSPVGGPAEVHNEVTEVGIDQGEVWLKLDGAPAKVWASQFTVSPRPIKMDEVMTAMGMPAQTETTVAEQEPDDSIDDDFATDPGSADEQQADALATLRARQGKAKKPGQKR